MIYAIEAIRPGSTIYGAWAEYTAAMACEYPTHLNGGYLIIELYFWSSFWGLSHFDIDLTWIYDRKKSAGIINNPFLK